MRIGRIANWIACAALFGAVTTPLFAQQESREPAPEALRELRVAVVVAAAQRPDADDVARVFSRASRLLEEKSGTRLVKVDEVEAGAGNAGAAARAYLRAHADAPPDGVIVLSDDEESREYGAYSLTVPLPAGHTNPFPSPIEGSARAYVAVVDMAHLYAKCGYDRRMNHVSTRSRGGECRGAEGLVCVDTGASWMCPDSVRDLNADRDYFLGCAIAHEFVHPFGALGDDDHYGTPQCTARTGMTAATAADRRLFQESCGMCPDLFAALHAAH